jgi:hypothetical protein
MENKMTRKITAILAAAVVLASAGVASAQSNRHVARFGAQPQAPYANSYYNHDYWAGAAGIVPGGPDKFNGHNPYAWTVFDGVAPY